jgi:hypothetical protein
VVKSDVQTELVRRQNSKFVFCWQWSAGSVPEILCFQSCVWLKERTLGGQKISVFLLFFVRLAMLYGLVSSSRPLLRPLTHSPITRFSSWRNILKPSLSHHSFSSSSENIWKTKDKILPILTSSDAQAALKVLYQHPDLYWACDTEVANIDVKTQGPIGNGNVICVSIYGGPTVDFGAGPGSVLWIENMNQSANLLQEFKPWFEDSRFKKVWHNYGFDRHVLYNEGINCLGFGGERPLSSSAQSVALGDTMHMARLWDTSLDKSAGHQLLLFFD